MTSRAYVFVNGLEIEPVICGIVELDVLIYSDTQSVTENGSTVIDVPSA